MKWVNEVGIACVDIQPYQHPNGLVSAKEVLVPVMNCRKTEDWDMHLVYGVGERRSLCGFLSVAQIRKSSFGFSGQVEKLVSAPSAQGEIELGNPRSFQQNRPETKPS